MLLIADENFPVPSYKYLRKEGFDITHIADSGYTSIKDEAVIELSVKQGRIIVTFDSDFGELIFKAGFKPIGVIFFRWKSFRPIDPGKYLGKLLKEGEIAFTNMLTVIDDQKIRQRKIK
ncbi:DUF5615 family PIN-like protein [Lewinella sp. JB7]|uniref:DUF5615 family PIN-like protein n=1 Tax=Lewinella sp. JB7 TaxID=2962887 RepID=UPI0020C9EDDD|nr:DUF5615 family PIN-like protein [Lewinella sp. JB7]MCP9237947.1 DUF5615 family PIN-like protein [Lewinella sp. JB7]